MSTSPSSQRPPAWFTAIIIAAALPMFSFPAMISSPRADDDSMLRLCLWGFPLYVIASALLAFFCWDERPLLSWILVILMAISQAALIYLTLV